MDQKLNKQLLILAVILVSACMLLTVGVTYARYQSEIDLASLWFSADVVDQIYLRGGNMTDELLKNGTWPSLDQSWTDTEDGQKLDFCVSNGLSANQFARRDQLVTIRLAAGLAILDPEKLTVTLSYHDGDGEVQLTAAAEPISEGTALYHSFGSGWIYRFYEDGEEVRFRISGGELHYQNFTVSVAGEAAALLDLQVAGQYDYEE